MQIFTTRKSGRSKCEKPPRAFTTRDGEGAEMKCPKLAVEDRNGNKEEPVTSLRGTGWGSRDQHMWVGKRIAFNAGFFVSLYT